MIHFSTRRVLGVWNFPVCYTFGKLLDLNKGKLPQSRSIDEVTCKHCLKYWLKGYTY